MRRQVGEGADTGNGQPLEQVARIQMRETGDTGNMQS